jgi:hypothetical protein
MNLNIIKQLIYYFLILIFLFALSIKFYILDFDLWDRLIMGNCVFNLGTPCFQDIISFTNTHTWFDPEWLSSWIIYLVANNFLYLHQMQIL